MLFAKLFRKVQKSRKPPKRFDLTKMDAQAIRVEIERVSKLPPDEAMKALGIKAHTKPAPGIGYQSPMYLREQKS